MATALVAALFLVATAAANDLLPPERAFALSARALDERTLEARFAVARGYYLYRDKLRFAVAPGALASLPVLPPGQMKDDEFFGRVETYRKEVVVRLTLDRPAAGERVTLNAESQGCADVGVCYPPQTQTLELTLPAAGRGAGPKVDAAPPKKSWFN
jgi:thiol:disulfide interchange protein DsbD